MKTRERIIEAAIRLFNEQGTAAVSTNHIAEAASVSPGNLYYHFRNKEEIIRAIFERLTVRWEAAAALPKDSTLSVHDLLRIIRGHFTVLQDYPFYYRELPALVHHDPLLAEQYRAMRAEGLANVEALLKHFGEEGVLNAPSDTRVLEKLAQICWILVDFWLPFTELTGGEPHSEHTRQGEELVLSVLLPYVAIDALAELKDSELPDNYDKEHLISERSKSSQGSDGSKRSKRGEA
jgi:AcrR family transcriptional regulator